MSLEKNPQVPTPDFLLKLNVDEEFDGDILKRVTEQYLTNKFPYRQAEALAYVCEYSEVSADATVGEIARFYGLQPESYAKAVAGLKDKKLLTDGNNGKLVASSDSRVVLAILQNEPHRLCKMPKKSEKMSLGKLYEIMNYIDTTISDEPEAWLEATGNGKSVYERIADNVSTDRLTVMRYVSRLVQLDFVELRKEYRQKGRPVNGIRLNNTGRQNLAEQQMSDGASLTEDGTIDKAEELESLQETCLELARTVGDVAVCDAIGSLRQRNEAEGYEHVDIEAQVNHAITNIERLRLIVKQARMNRV